MINRGQFPFHSAWGFKKVSLLRLLRPETEFHRKSFFIWKNFWLSDFIRRIIMIGG